MNAVPIDEVLKRNGKIGRDVAQRIRRLNPEGHIPGNRIRGWNPHPRINRFNMDVIGPRAFIARYGREAYRAIPRSRLIHQGHRKAVSEEYCMEIRMETEARVWARHSAYTNFIGPRQPFGARNG